MRLKKLLCKLGIHKYSNSTYVCDWAEGDDRFFCLEIEICEVCKKKRTHSFYVSISEYWKRVLKHDGERLDNGTYRLIVK